ncbi:hypothetical protein [Pseudomonas sp. NPDC089396]|uniref:hypothetical protein n=1 Tax=Pseudomonas sp. NPDC089396 TaxID=3364461 RepID=UPI003837A863
MLRKKSLTLAITFALSTSLLSGCGEEPENFADKDGKSIAQRMQEESELKHKQLEEEAQRKREEAFKASIAMHEANSTVLPDLPVADDSAYLDIHKPWMPGNLYIAFNGFNESDETLIDVLQVYTQYDGYPKGIAELSKKYMFEKDGFAKIDLAKNFKELLVSESSKINGVRYVKFEIKPKFAEIATYDFNRKGFSLSPDLFTDKRDLTESDKKGMNVGSSFPPARSYFNGSPISLHYGFTEATALQFVPVEDQAIARKIEAVRTEASVVIYGYLKSVEHAERAKDNDRYLNIKPQRADFVSPAGEVLYSVTL